MINRKWIYCSPLVLLLLFSVSPMAFADLYWEAEQVTKGVLGQSDETKNVKNYLTSNATRTDIGDKVTIVDFDTMTTYQLNTKDKTYIKVTFVMPKMEGEQAQVYQDIMMKDMMIKKMVMHVTSTNETKKIAGYRCRKYNVTYMFNCQYWVSKDVKEYNELKAIYNKIAKIFQENPLMKRMNILGMMDKLDGFPVQAVMNMMGGTITTTLKNIKKKSLSKNLFKVPKGYALKEWLSLDEYDGRSRRVEAYEAPITQPPDP